MCCVYGTIFDIAYKARKEHSMNFFLMALATGILGALPLFARGKFVAACMLCGLSTAFFWFGYWVFVPSTIGFFWGPIGFWVIVLWILAAILDGAQENGPTHAAWFPVGGVLLLIVTLIGSSSMFHAKTYASMVGNIEERVWTQDVQPKDPRHMRMVSGKTANYLAKKAISQGGTIGSQFELDTSRAFLQKVRGELVYIYPLDYRGFWTWRNSSDVPAYIVVYAEDPERIAHLVELPKEKRMAYTPGAYFGNNLERHLRNNGFMGEGLSNIHLELDEDNNPFWVVTTYELVTNWFGDKVTGIATINPTTGQITRYGLDKIPSWIDRVFPSSFVKEYLADRGSLSDGWANSWFAKLNISKPEDPILIYGEGDRAEFVVGMTSHNDKDDSLLGLMYTDSRSGKTVYYKINGGATDTAIIQAVNSNSQVKYLHLTATTPQIYNVYGHMVAVVPLINDISAYQMVAIVNVLNLQDVAVGQNQNQALQAYQALLSRRGQQVALEGNAKPQKLTGIVDRIRQDVNGGNTSYLFHIVGAPRIFVGSSTEGDQSNLKLVLTQPGDTVVVEYLASGEMRVPVVSFDNLSLPLDKTQMQGEVERAAKEREDAEKRRAGALTLPK